MGIKIAIMGTHSTGKTTFTQQLAEYLKFKGKKVEAITEIARKCPFPIHENTTLKAQDWIIKTQIDEENKKSNYDFLVCDRSVFDDYAYLYYALKADHKEIYSDVLDHMKTYDVLFLTKSKEDSKAEDDGFRSTSDEFRIEIERIIYNKLEVMKPFFDMSNIKIIKVDSFEDIKKFVDENY